MNYNLIQLQELGLKAAEKPLIVLMRVRKAFMYGNWRTMRWSELNC
ncbi:hypothetical protein [Paenibacillus sp.]|jgi:hypothetical protein|nr:hypothetical protein [Paenibacillus sp.]MDR0269177.1 hypothetical protein [Paenibacillus sp.]